MQGTRLDMPSEDYKDKQQTQWFSEKAWLSHVENIRLDPLIFAAFKISKPVEYWQFHLIQSYKIKDTNNDYTL